MGLPDVTVIVVAYNDAGRLPLVVESVRRQTLRNLEVIIVDDASTDGTGEVAGELAARDPRISAVHLAEHSGGRSRPRNVGLDHARAPYVMFLDTDGEYERHACKNLLYAAERSGADIAAGRCVRVHPGTGRVLPWWEKLYAEPAVHEGIAGQPDQLRDSLSTNKLFRRAFLTENDLRFPEGVHYEDLLFVTEAYCAADRIAVVRNLICSCNGEGEAPLRSTTSGTGGIADFRRRIEVHTRIKQYLREHERSQLEAVVDRKFIQDDLRLCLDRLTDQSPQHQREVMALAASHLERIDGAAYEDVPPVQRARAYLVRQGDLVETLKATHHIGGNHRLTMDLVRRDGRVYFTGKYLDDPVGRRLLDVSDLPGLDGPLSQVRFENRIVEVKARRSGIALVGRLHDPLGLITEDGLRGTLRFRSRDSDAKCEAGVDEIRRDGASVCWSARVDLRRLLPVASPDDRVWAVQCEVECSEGSNVTPLCARHIEHVRAPLAWPFGTLADTVTTGVSSKGNLRLRLTVEGRALRLLRRVLRRLRRWSPYRRIVGLAGLLRSQRLKRIVYRKVLRHLPARRGQIVFESHMGKQYSDSPKYIYQALARSGTPHRAVWSYTGDTAEFPAGVKLVERHSWAYYYALARARFWIDNQGFPRHIDKPRGTTYVQTWHGTPLKKMGFDTDLGHQPLAKQREFQTMIDRWDCMAVQNEFTVNTLVPAFRFNGEVLRTGLPRNDALVAGGHPESVRRIRERLGIPINRKIVLYAPTYRDARRKRRQPFAMKLGLAAMERALRDEYVLLVRTHYLDRYRIPNRHRSFAFDVSKYHDITELLLVSDVLITDYSSVMFDYANLRRPMIFYTYDYGQYAGTERGLYLELEDIAPGPVVGTTEDVVKSLVDLSWHERDYSDRYDAFISQFCEYDAGKAATTIVERIIAGRA